MIRTNGWIKYSIWDHSKHVHELYRRRCELQEEEMTCHKQATTLLAPLISAGDSLLDVGCGSGYFFHSLRNRLPQLEYFGIDACESLISIGRSILPNYGLPSERLIPARIEDLDGSVDHVICINVLSNIDNFHKPLERLLAIARKSVILRESIADTASYQYVQDTFLDTGVNLSVYVNTYNREEVFSFIKQRGFSVKQFQDEYSGGKPEKVIGYDHHWNFLVATRNTDTR